MRQMGAKRYGNVPHETDGDFPAKIDGEIGADMENEDGDAIDAVGAAFDEERMKACLAAVQERDMSKCKDQVDGVLASRDDLPMKSNLDLDVDRGHVNSVLADIDQIVAKAAAGDVSARPPGFGMP